MIVEPKPSLEELVLMHYGVKGMKWGVRNERKQERRERRAQKFDTKAELFQQKIDDLNRDPARNWVQKNYRARKTKDLSEVRDQALRDAEAKRQGKLSKRQKQIVVGAAVVGALLVAKGTYNATQSGDFTRLSAKGREFLGMKEAGFKKNRILASSDLNIEGLKTLVVDKINPDYEAWGAKSNCRRATFTYEMRRRGYDVTATRTTTGRGQDLFGIYNATTQGKAVPSSISRRVIRLQRDKPLQEFLSNSPMVGKHEIGSSMDFSKSIFDALGKQPSGARGELGMTWKMGGGHSMAWEIVKGKPVIFDTQTGEVFQGIAEFAKTAGSMASAGFSRLDDVELNEDFLKRWMKDA